jgi:hypothetical protein
VLDQHEGEAKSARRYEVLTHVKPISECKIHNMLSQAGQDPPPIDFFWVTFDYRSPNSGSTLTTKTWTGCS